MIELIMMVLLLRVMKSKGKGKVRVSVVKRRRRKKRERNVWKNAGSLLKYTKRVWILIKFPKYPFNKLQDITFFPPYKNLSPNFTTRKRNNN